MARRRGRGEGSIYQRADGTWCSSITFGYTQDGKRRRRTVYGRTKGEVQEKLTRLHTAASGGTLTEPTRLTLSGFLDRWLEDVQRPNLRIATYTRYRSLIKTHINPHLGGVRLASLHPATVQALYGELDKKGASGRTRELVHAVLHKAFKQAVHWGFLARNPCDAVARPRPAKRAIRYFTAEETQTFLKTAKSDRLYALYLFALTTGLRQGELVGLKWRDVDWSAGAIAVRRTIEDAGGKLHVGEPNREG